ncbi:MAG TPA: DUF2892 domain-containing protein [Bacilli bacterium]|nr:DUF2892 domain-containing protein [Bacilli bacterium]
MKTNIGTLNALIRIACGLTMLAYSTAKMVRKPYSGIPFFIAMTGAMKVAEGIVRFCPLTYVFKQQIEEMNKEFDDECVNINPS